MKNEDKDLYAVFVEVEGFDRPLFLIGLTFARLIDDVVVPYEGEKPFFVDGVPVTRKKIRRIKILRQKERFLTAFEDLHIWLRRGSKEQQKLFADQYFIRLEAALREGGEDVTSQVIKAYDEKIRPSLKEYVMKRPELIQAAYQAFLATLKVLGNS